MAGRASDVLRSKCCWHLLIDVLELWHPDSKPARDAAAQHVRAVPQAVQGAGLRVYAIKQMLERSGKGSYKS